MSNNEEKPSLKDLVNKISSGVGNLARKKPGQDSASQGTEPTIDLGSAAAKSRLKPTHTATNWSPWNRSLRKMMIRNPRRPTSFPNSRWGKS
ncbi:hypothetical protein P4198_01295 [Pseudomonas aeruginosa]|nr:hypothetical protein [Pseudomonas aeruginosa]